MNYLFLFCLGIFGFVAVADDGASAAGDPGQLLDATLQAVDAAGGDITALDGAAAVGNISQWTSELDGVDGAMKVTANLEELSKQLSAGEINGQLVGLILVTLAEDTKMVAGESAGAGVNALVDALRAGGDKLTEATVTGAGHLAETLRAVKGAAADITTLPVEAAVANVDAWVGELAGVEGGDAIVADLQSLKTELTSPTIDGAAVSDLLFALAEGTEAAAPDDFGLAALAYALESGGWRLKPEGEPVTPAERNE